MAYFFLFLFLKIIFILWGGEICLGTGTGKFSNQFFPYVTGISSQEVRLGGNLLCPLSLLASPKQAYSLCFRILTACVFHPVFWISFSHLSLLWGFLYFWNPSQHQGFMKKAQQMTQKSPDPNGSAWIFTAQTIQPAFLSPKADVIRLDILIPVGWVGGGRGDSATEVLVELISEGELEVVKTLKQMEARDLSSWARY